MSVGAVGGSPWYARALGALSDAGSANTEPASAPPPSLDDVSPRVKRNLVALAGSLGTEPETVLAHLSSGQGIRSLLAGTTHAGYSVAQPPSGGLAIDEYA